jgi:putative oxidoreductase
MSLSATIAKTRKRLLTLVQRLSFLAPLLLRLTLGLTFVHTGWQHLAHLDKTIEAFTGWGVPMPELNARVASVTELFGGLAVLLGIGTRLACLPLTFTMLVAIATAQKDEVDGLISFVSLNEWAYATMFLALAIIGPGPVSADAAIARWLERRAAEDAPAPAGS